MSRGRRQPARLHGPIVVDANILFSALLREGTTRHLLLYGDLDLHTPEAIWDEFDRNRAYLLKKSRATDAAFDLLVDSLKDRIGAIPRILIRAHLEQALAQVGKADELDAPYVAAALALGATLWTHDKRLKERTTVPVVTTSELVEATGLP